MAYAWAQRLKFHRSKIDNPPPEQLRKQERAAWRIHLRHPVLPQSLPATISSNSALSVKSATFQLKTSVGCEAR